MRSCVKTFLRLQETAVAKERTKKMKTEEVMQMLKEGVGRVFSSEEYQKYLTVMSRFPSYSYSNVLLIYMQKPDASYIAGYKTWQKKFNRRVRAGEKGIRIIAPMKFKRKENDQDQEFLRFRSACVFDISQTEGDPLPSGSIDELQGDVLGYEKLMTILKEISPVYIRKATICGDVKGYFDRTNEEIVIKEGMSRLQEVKTCLHEITHAILHAEKNPEKDRRTCEVEAESTAFVVCKRLGFDTDDYSFPYIAGWSSGKEIKELLGSAATIQRTADKLITEIERRRNK